jgi:Major tropism determinant N-terminal domain
MPITQISQIQIRRGLEQDLPKLAPGELGWSVDSRRIYVGNGTLAEGAPAEGRTEILTEFSVVNFTNSLTSEIAAISSNVSTLQSQIVVLQAELPTTKTAVLLGGDSGTVDTVTANNAVVNYTLLQGEVQRTGYIRLSRDVLSGTVMYDEEYNQTDDTDVVFSVTSNISQASLQYSAGSNATMLYQITSIL